MTIREMKRINRQIGNLRGKIERLRTEATNISPKLSDAPRGGSVTDKLGGLVAQINDTQRELDQLLAFRKAELGRLSLDVYEENCIFLFLARGNSWRRIATVVDGRPDAAESIKKRCYRYSW